MELLRNLRASTRVLFLYEVTTSRHSRLRTIAERLGMTVQGCSDYAHGLERDGLLAMVDGEYRATKKGVEFLHDRLVDLRSFVERARREMAFIDTTRSEEHTSELQSPDHLVCRLLLVKDSTRVLPHPQSAL